MKTERLYIPDIAISDRLRGVDTAKVGAIKASIEQIGLRTPITVSATRNGDEWTMRLIAGAHRIEAMRQTGAEFIDAIVMDGDEDDAALWEIDENFARAELTDAQRADHHVRREAILVRRGEVSAKGGDRRSNAQNAHSVGYAAKTAGDLGLHASTIRRDLARGKKIAPEVLAQVSGTDLDRGVVLDELARTPQPDQRAKLAEISLRRHEAEQARKGAEAANKNADRVIALTNAEQYAMWLLARLDLNELATIISWIEGTEKKDVIAALRREAA